MLRGRIFILRPLEPDWVIPEMGSFKHPPYASIIGGFFMNIFKDLSKISIQSWAFMAGILLASALISRILNKNKRMSTKKLTYGSLCIALSFVLSYVRLYKMPQGGSITPGSMIPIMLFAFMFGPADGIIAGIVYGILQFVQDTYIVHWVQVFLDYPLAFGALGLAGYAKKNFSLGLLYGGFGRFVFHFLSGVFFFADYAIELGQNPIWYSISYNGIVVGVEIAVCIVISLIPQFKNAIKKIQSSAV